MKRIFLLLLAFTPLYAFGDYVPGRTRASAKAELQRQRGDGRYQSVVAANARQFVSDGRGITHFTLALNRSRESTFVVRAIRATRCGRTYVAALPSSPRRTELRIDEISSSACRADGKVFWRAFVATQEGNGRVSRLSLAGEPQFFLLTQ